MAHKAYMFCTAGRGTEQFICEELCQKLNAEKVQKCDGKVFFYGDVDAGKLSSLKSVERLFVSVHYDPSFRLEDTDGLHFLKCQLEQFSNWDICFQHWSYFQQQVEILKHRESLPAPPPEPVQKFSVPPMSPWSQGAFPKMIQSDPKVVYEPKKIDTCMYPAHAAASCTQQSIGRMCEPGYMGMNGPHTSQYLHGEHHAPLPVREPIATMSSNQEKSAGQTKRALDDTSKDSEPPVAIKLRKTSDPVTFRISCKMAGKAAKMFSSKAMGRTVGVSLHRKLGWHVQLRNPLIEVFIQINDAGLVVGIPLTSQFVDDNRSLVFTRQPLSKRPYLRSIGLRTTVAWIMAHLANIKAGHTVLDPMCGAGTILVEASTSWEEACYLGCDTSKAQLQKAYTNVVSSHQNNRIELFHSDVKAQIVLEIQPTNDSRYEVNFKLALPLLSSSVDCIVCDLPFGEKYSSRDGIKQLYPEVLKSMDRVLKVGGRAILLTSMAYRSFLLKQVKNLLSSDTVSSSTSTMSEVQHPTLLKDTLTLVCGDNTSKCTDMDQICSSPSTDQHTGWIFKDSFYLKLGETDGALCMFDKILS